MMGVRSGACYPLARVMLKRLPSAAGLLLWLGYGLACKETGPPPTLGARAETAPSRSALLQCFSDQQREICLDADEKPDPMLVYINGHPLPFHGEWAPQGKRVPKLEGHLGSVEAGPKVVTGPNGALRVQCASGMRQFFKGRQRPQDEGVPHERPVLTSQQRENPCVLLGL